MARRRKHGTGIPAPRAADLRLAAAIADAVGPRFELLTAEVSGLRAEVGGLRAEMHSGFVELRQEMGELRNEMGELRMEMHSGFASVRDEVHQLREGVVGIGRIAKLEARVDELEKRPR